MQRNGHPMKYPEDGHRVGLAHPALILLPDNIQNIVGLIFDSPTLTLARQPKFWAELGRRQGTDQPGATPCGLGANAPVHPRNLNGSGQAQFFWLDAARDDGPIFGPPFIGLGLLVLRGERSPAGESERF